ncbi:hypothetical protein CDD81_787 [Ophiocordyceps australis]|uniref:Chromo domain-containing protein n=1 Tax=Ophiocordyceps australis TaxID=1399860 RepID=A0A2C5Y078_9HYPO|nr:hypothetical protein CDD81_787 [Ophiocordyceps australis]
MPLSKRPPKKPRLRNGKTATQIVIPITTRPPDYVPGSGPPLQRVSLLPCQDSTGYIVERILLPSSGLARDGRPLPKRMTYIVGWRDLPAARLLVPAMQILDFVSPRALEQWEWEMELEVEQDRQSRADEAKLEQTAAQHDGAAKDNNNNNNNKKKKKKKKKQRPPAHTAIESAAVVEAEGEAQMRPKKGAMSLSTPQKTRMEEFDDDSLDDVENSPSRQLERELNWPWATDVLDETLDETHVGTGQEVTGYASDSDRGLSPAAVERLKNSWRLPPEFSDEPMLATGEASQPADPPKPPKAKYPPQTPVPLPPMKYRAQLLAPSSLSNGGFTSLNKGHVQFDLPSHRQPETPSTTALESARSAPSSSKASSKNPSANSKDKKPSQRRKRSSNTHKELTELTKPVLGQDGQAEWVVKLILNMQFYEVEGRGIVRYFQILWEGDWPPDQNPTWEPEENVPSSLVKNYLKTSKERRRQLASSVGHGNTTKPSRTSEQLGYTKKRSKTTKRLRISEQFHSVGEAFAGGTDKDEVMEDQESAEPQGNGQANDMDQELFVVEAELPDMATWSGRGSRSSEAYLF